MNRLEGLLSFFGFCLHRWTFESSVHLNNLPQGLDCWLEIHACRKCGKTKTVELPNR